MDIKVFESPISGSFVYPCSISDIQQALSLLPATDLIGLEAVGLTHAGRKRWKTSAEYVFFPTPRIHIYSFPGTYDFSVKGSLGSLRRTLQIETSFWMSLKQDGRIVKCSWDTAGLRAFTLCHVLPHEVGHHVFRFHQGKPFDSDSYRVSEAFADDYARRVRPFLTVLAAT